jgi:glycerol-3-phosphate O-acyltransferase
VLDSGVRSVPDILTTAKFEASLRDVSRQTGVSVDELRVEAAADLNEMATKPGRYTVVGWDRFCRWLARAYKLDFKPDEMRSLQALNKESALIFLPNHRSYLDPLVLRSALEEWGFPPNNTLGGSNLALWPLSAVGRRNGIVFIRREFRDDHLYRVVLKTYLADLIQHRKNLEWYIEGGRTRTGKLRPPRYGILSYVIEAIAEYPENDVQIVPTSIVYDQQHEVTAISAEEMGGTKSAESISWLYNFAKSQSRRLGRAHLRFGEPLSLHDALELTIDDEGHTRPRLAVPKVAFEVANRINTVTPVTPSALVTFALLDNGDRAITVEEGRWILEPLLEYIKIRRIPVTGNMDLSTHGLLRDSVETLVRESVITSYEGGTEAVFMIELEHQHEAAFYRNTIIHWFITRAITELALVQAAEDNADDVKTATWENARRLKNILKFEFFFPNTRDFAAEVADETSIVYPGWESADFTSDRILALLADLKLHLAHRVVGPFLEAYSVLADELALIPAHVEINKDDLVARSLGIAQQRWLQRSLHTPESISKDYFKNAYQLAANQHLLETSEPDLEQRRQAFAAELQTAVRGVDAIRRLAQDSGQPVLIERAQP